ncbi:MAG TPA: hypothetical protein VGI81_11770 [Tepidisphaeraceae bacterium]|jgi:hypothetical protein
MVQNADTSHDAIVKLGKMIKGIDAPSSTMTQIIGFTKAILTGHRYIPGEHEKMNLQVGAEIH